MQRLVLHQEHVPIAHGKDVEHWDVLKRIPEKSGNKKTMF